MEEMNIITLIIVVANRVGIPVLLFTTVSMFFSSEDEERVDELKGWFYRVLIVLLVINIFGFLALYLMK